MPKRSKEEFGQTDSLRFLQTQRLVNHQSGEFLDLAAGEQSKTVISKICWLVSEQLIGRALRESAHVNIARADTVRRLPNFFRDVRYKVVRRIFPMVLFGVGP